jgi:hypothetical protein
MCLACHGSSSSRGGGSHAQLQQQLLAAGADLVAGLLLEGRDEGPLPPDVAGVPATERDVQVRMRVLFCDVCRTYVPAGRAGAMFVCVACIAPDLAPHW